MFRPADLLATQVASTAVSYDTEQPWRLHPGISQFVTSLCSRYANRLIRETDGKGTFTPQDSQPYRLLPITSTLRLTACRLAVLRLTTRVTPLGPRTCYPVAGKTFRGGIRTR